MDAPLNRSPVLLSNGWAWLVPQVKLIYSRAETDSHTQCTGL